MVARQLTPVAHQSFNDHLVHFHNDLTVGAKETHAFVIPLVLWGAPHFLGKRVVPAKDGSLGYKATSISILRHQLQTRPGRENVCRLHRHAFAAQIVPVGQAQGVRVDDRRLVAATSVGAVNYAGNGTE